MPGFAVRPSVRRLAAAGAAALVAATVAAAGSPIHTAAAGSTVTIVADHLNNPRQLSWGPGGALFVAEAGSGGTLCAPQGCAGTTGSVTRIKDGRQARVVTGLLSGAGPDGSFAVGSDGVSLLDDGHISVVTTFLGAGLLPPSLEALQGRLFRTNPGNKLAVIADITAYALNHDVFNTNDSNPYNVLALPGHELVVDAASNQLFDVRGSTITTVASFPKPAYDPPSVQDTVPTTIVQGPDGAFYVGELGGDGTPAGGSRVWRVVPGQPPAVIAGGFNAVTGLAFGPDGSMYVTELTTDRAAFTPLGDVVRVHPDGSRTRLGFGSLFFPQGAAVAPNGDVYVSNYSVLPAQDTFVGPGAHGQVVKISQ